MIKLILLWSTLVICVIGIPATFSTKKFFVGIEYEKSLPMEGGSDRYRHRNNYEPFYVTVTTQARKGFVLDYLEVTATTDPDGDVEFCLLHGQAGSKTMIFQLSSNNSDFLYYTYMSYGIKEDTYKKMSSYIFIPIFNKAGINVKPFCTFFITFIIIIVNYLF